MDQLQQQQQEVLKQELTVPQILRTYGKQFKQIQMQYSDGHNGRCALGVIMSYYGWDGKDDSQAAKKLLGTLIALSYAGIDKNLLTKLNDTGMPFDEIADYLDNIGNSKYW
jgi:3'-phosphoadenosine 5'-phosphosulfate sulfotransferase (PAPS reductase)/FAD synthetase